MNYQDVIADMLADAGSTHFFHVPVVLPATMKRLIERGVRPVVAHGEKAAAYMADGYARASGRPGLCGAQAIGGTNLAAGLRDAYMARVPVIALTGGSEPATRHLNVYQEHDDMPIFDRLTVFNAVADRTDRVPDLLRQAFRSATAGAGRPVHLEFPGAAANRVPGGEITGDVAPIDARYTATPSARVLADPTDVASAARTIVEASRPLVLIGGGVRRSGAVDQVVELVERLQIPAVSTLTGLGVLPDGHRLATGVVGGYAQDHANAIAAEADVIIVVGSSLGSMATRDGELPSPSTRVIHIDIDPAEPGRTHANTLGLVGDARSVLDQVLRELGATAETRPQRLAWTSHVAAERARWREQVHDVESSERPSMRPERLWRAVSDSLPDAAVVVADTGHTAAWSGRHLALRAGHTFIRTAGSLGWALPAAIGARCATPDRPVICLTGDAGAYYHLAELETARRYSIPVVVVINNNAGMNQEQVLWRAGTAEDANWKFTDVDFSAVAAALGCAGYVATSGDEVEAALDKAVADGVPAVIDARTDPAAMAPTIYHAT